MAFCRWTLSYSERSACPKARPHDTRSGMHDALIAHEPTTPARRLVLLFHGVGSSPEDLLPLGQAVGHRFPDALVVERALAGCVGLRPRLAATAPGPTRHRIAPAARRGRPRGAERAECRSGSAASSVRRDSHIGRVSAARSRHRHPRARTHHPADERWGQLMTAVPSPGDGLMRDYALARSRVAALERTNCCRRNGCTA